VLVVVDVQALGMLLKLLLLLLLVVMMMLLELRQR